ncbi:MAG: hypothetical protein GX359_08310 [Clostridiales bacterium]|nr:hypothetical protein [Clostridiales bacterium]
MKLVYAIVRNNDSNKVTESLNKKGLYVTKVASTGGFRRQGNTTLLIGIEDDRVDEVLEIIKKECGSTQEVTNPVEAAAAQANTKDTESGATVFVTNVECFVKI